MAEIKSNRYNAEQTKNDISTALKELFLVRDFDKISIRDICKQAKVSVGTLYMYYPCKEACLLAMYQEGDVHFNNIAYTENIKSNLLSILQGQIKMVRIDNKSIIKQVLISHLKYHDEYFFSEQRPLFVELYTQITDGQKRAVVTDKYDAKIIVWKLLRFVRGQIYDFAINEELYKNTDWYQFALTEVEEYLNIFMQ